MLESRSAYGWYGSHGGVTGENSPADHNAIERRMPYYKFKRDYPECKHYGYDAQDKTIIVLIPEERQNGSNFGNNYHISRFYFWIYDVYGDYYFITEQDAKTNENAERHVKAWCKRTQRGEHGAIKCIYERVATRDEFFKYYGSKNSKLTPNDFRLL